MLHNKTGSFNFKIDIQFQYFFRKFSENLHFKGLNQNASEIQSRFSNVHTIPSATLFLKSIPNLTLVYKLNDLKEKILFNA